MRNYFQYNQQFLTNSQPYQVGDVAFFDWDTPPNRVTNHVLIISEVDGNGRPLKMVDASSVLPGNPSGNAWEHSWSSYYDQRSQGHGRLNGTLVASTATVTQTVQVLRVAVNSPSVTLRLQDANGRSTSSTYDENLVASNIEAFIPYIPGGVYTDFGTSKVITVTQPLSNTSQYLIQITGAASTQYQLDIQTFQDGALTASTTSTQSIALNQTQGFALQLSAPSGTITFTASAPTIMPQVNAVPTTIQMNGLPGTPASTTFTLTEVSNQQAFNGASVSVSNLMSQDGQIISGALFNVTPSSFNVPAGGNQAVQFTLNLANIPIGLYHGSVVITSTNGGTQRVLLSLIVEPFHSYLPLIAK